MYVYVKEGGAETDDNGDIPLHILLIKNHGDGAPCSLTPKP